MEPSPLLRLLPALALASAVSAAPVGMFDPRQINYYRACGNYCGPAWSNGSFISEGEMFRRHQAGHPLIEPMGASCADTCCQSHDMCCGSGNETLRHSCNREMLGCLQSCGNDETCLDENQTPFLFDSLVAALESVQGQCCGVMCDPAHDATRQLNGKLVNIAVRTAAGVANKVWWEENKRKEEKRRRYRELSDSMHGNASLVAGYAAQSRAAEARRWTALHPAAMGA